MMKNILIGALAGAAVAYLLVEKDNKRTYEMAFDHIGDYFTKMKRKFKGEMKTGKHHAACMGDRAAGMINQHMHHS